jgi:predicted phage baseplate assembly protein
MTAWWGREATPGDPPELAADGTPILLAGSRDAIAAAVRARISAYTPAWSRGGNDAGDTLVRLFAEQVEAIATRLARWPEKALVELLVTADLAQRAATPATALVAFTISPAAGSSVLVPAGLQLGARPPGSGDLVIYETDSDLVAAPVRIAGLFVEQEGALSAIAADPLPSSVLPFGAVPDRGRALWIGLDGDATLGPELALGFGVATPPDAPPPVDAGGVIAGPEPARPLLRWQLLDGATLRPLEVIRDDTAALARTGAAVVALPRTWAAGAPPASDAATLRWLRVELASGAYERAPELVALVLNAVSATAATTIRDEVLESIDASGRVYQLVQSPVVSGSLVIEVDEGQELSSALAGGTSGTVWREVDNLGQFGPEDRVFVLDAALGIVYTGDGVHGAAVPPGVANVLARAYRAGGGSSGAVAADAITTLIGSAPFATAVTNPMPASGGADVEPRAAAIARGPEEIRARGRAVTLADYELMALATPFADVRRAHAVAGNPAYPAAFTTGVVGVLVVPAERGDGPPLADAELLTKVAQYLAAAVAPAGVEVVAAGPAFHRVAIDARVILERGIDVGASVEAALAAMDAYLDPLLGGDDGGGWPFGGALGYIAIVRRLLAVPGVLAVPELEIVVDGETFSDCADVALPAGALVWPASHQIIPIDGGTL